MYQITMRVEGMKCSMCENHICEQIRNQWPVQKASASRKKSEVIIITELEIAPKEISGLISQLGYTVSTITTAPLRKKKGLWHRL